MSADRPDFVAEVESGDRRRALEALRGKLARRIADCPDDRDLAALTLRLQRVLADIDELGGKADTEGTDALAARRAAKLQAATGT